MSARADQQGNVTKHIGEVIRTYRLAKGVTQAELARFAGMAPNSVALIERGERNPGVETLRRLSAGLGVKMVDILRHAGY